MKSSCLAVFLVCSVVARADWPADAGLDVPVVNVEISRKPSIVDDGKGGVFVVFAHSDATPNETLRGEHFDEQGNRLWSTAVDGGFLGKDLLGLSVTPQGAATIYAVSDEDGGLIASYAAGPSQGPWPVTLQRFQADGTALWTPTGNYGGVEVASAPADNNSFWMISDQAGGAFVTWQLANGAGVVGQRLDPTGAQLYADAHTFTSGQASSSSYPTNLASGDGQGGIYYLWSPNGDYNTDPMLEHVNPNGSSNFLVSSVAPSHPLFDEWAVVGTSISCWATWFQNGSPNGFLYLQSYGSGGAALIAGDGGGALVELTGRVGATYAQLANDGDGGVIFAWEDISLDAGNVLYAQRFNPDGTNAWGNSPISVSMPGATTLQSDPFRLISASDGRSVGLVWQTLPNGINAERLLISTGAAQWGPLTGGVEVSTAPTGVNWLDATFASDNSAYVTWQDGLNRIFVKRVNADGTLGPAVLVPDAGPDAGEDTGSDAGADAGSDAGEDAGPMPVPDAGIDAGPDAGIDDGGDAGGSPDAGVVLGGPDAGSVAKASGCASTSGGARPFSLAILMLVLWTAARRRRERGER